MVEEIKGGLGREREREREGERERERDRVQTVHRMQVTYFPVLLWPSNCSLSAHRLPTDLKPSCPPPPTGVDAPLCGVLSDIQTEKKSKLFC